MSTITSKPDRTTKLAGKLDSYRDQVGIGLDDTNEATATLQDGHIKLGSLDEARKAVLRGHNNTGATITKYKFVYNSGWDPTNKANTIALAENTTPNYSFGFVTLDLADGETGHVASLGVLEDVDTSGATAGDPVYLGTNGDFTLVQPANSQQIGQVMHADALAGQIYIDIRGDQGAVDLGTTYGATDVTVTNTAGSDATIDQVGANPGVMIPGDKTKLDGIEVGANNYVHPNHTGEVTSVGDGDLTIEDRVIEGINIKLSEVFLENLAADAITNLTKTVDATTNTIVCSTGTDVILDLAQAGVAGLLQDIERQKILDTVWVTDFGADPTGNTNAAPAVTSAIAYAVSRRIGRVVFPRGLYLMNSTVVLPVDDSDPSYKLIIDLGGSRLRTTLDITIFERTRTTPDVPALVKYAVNIRDGIMEQNATKGEGVAIHIENQQYLEVSNINFRNFKRAVYCEFCLEHAMRNLNAYGCEESYTAKSMIGSGGGSFDSNSNVGAWVNCRAWTDTATAVCFTFRNCGGITLISCVTEGTAVKTPILIDGAENATLPVGNNDDVVPDRGFHFIEHWVEYEQTDTITDSTIVKLKDVQRSSMYFNLLVRNKMPAGTRLIICEGNTAGRCSRNVFHVDKSQYFTINEDIGEWIDPDVQVGVADRQNLWKFTDCQLAADDTFDDPARWTGGIVPPHRDENFDQARGIVRDNVLTGAGGTLPLNQDAADALMKPVRVLDLPVMQAISGNYVMGQQADGSFARTDVAQVARVNGEDNIPFASPIAIDFDDPLAFYDRKRIILTGDAFDLILTATRLTKYQLVFEQNPTGFHRVFITTDQLRPSIIQLPLVPSPGGVSTLDLEYVGNNLFTWG